MKTISSCAECMDAFSRQVRGEITREEAIAIMHRHGDQLAYEMLNNGFKVDSYEDIPATGSICAHPKT